MPGLAMSVKPYKEGAVWSFRLRLRGESIYRTGFPSDAAASRECAALRQKLLDEATGRAKHDGPWRTTLAQALQLYALERLPFLKGARQDANRINRYLRAAGLACVQISKPERIASGSMFWSVSLREATPVRKIPKGLKAHRAAQVERTESTDRQISTLALTSVAEIRAHQLQDLFDTMQRDHFQPATVGLERALLRQLFNYMRKTWLWTEPAGNPATHLTLPKVDNARDRVLTNEEWRRISEQLEQSKNRYAAPALALLLETAMRVSEPLLHATWADVDWNNHLIHLRDAKAGARDVPLNPAAVSILETLRVMRSPDDADERILPVTYEALKACWRRACEAAGIPDVRIHDLRHTAATRFTLELNGNLPVLKVITGHKTYSQLARYINVKPTDVARLLHGRSMTDDDAPAGLRIPSVPQEPASVAQTWDPNDALPENVVPLRRSVPVGNVPAQLKR